jgi:hypothetical protein
VFKTYSARERGKGGKGHLDEGGKKALAEILELMKPYLRA